MVGSNTMTMEATTLAMESTGRVGLSVKTSRSISVASSTLPLPTLNSSLVYTPILTGQTPPMSSLCLPTAAIRSGAEPTAINTQTASVPFSPSLRTGLRLHRKWAYLGSHPRRPVNLSTTRSLIGILTPQSPKPKIDGTAKFSPG